MSQQYRLHFGSSKTKKYPQLLKLADLARHHEVRGSGKDVWHILTFDDSQIDLMAQAHSLAGSRPSCEVRLRGVPVWLLRSGAYPIETDQKPNPNARSTIWSRARAACIQLMKELNLTAPQFKTYLEDTYYKEIRSDNKQINNVLRAHGYLPTGKVEEEGKARPSREPEEHIALYRDIRNLISAGQYAQAVNKYYESLGDEPFGELNNELLYLKRLANIPISGRDLLAFRPKGSWPTLIKDNVWEYCSSIDSVLEMFQKAGRASPLDVLVESVPPLDQLLERKQRWLNKGVSLGDGDVKISKTVLTVDNYGTSEFPRGRLFDRYADALTYHADEEDLPDTIFLTGLWTTYDPTFVEKKILGKGFYLEGIEAYKHKKWRLHASKKREPAFTSVQSLDDVQVSTYYISGIRYTGQRHRIGNKTFYEIDLLRKAFWLRNRSLPSLQELAEDVLREAENQLREKHGLPRIGEGWVSEMLLYDLVKGLFADAEHHVRLPWLKPQELDVWVPSKQLAFEYQGIQHYEDLEFFGGKAGFESRQELDRRKRNKCRAHDISLIEWRYDQPIELSLLLQKLKGVDKEPGS